MEIIDFLSFINVYSLSAKMKLIHQNQIRMINFKTLKIKIRINYKKGKNFVTKKNKRYL
jgi:hypothetical protein